MRRGVARSTPTFPPRRLSCWEVLIQANDVGLAAGNERVDSPWQIMPRMIGIESESGDWRLVMRCVRGEKGEKLCVAIDLDNLN